MTVGDFVKKEIKTLTDPSTGKAEPFIDRHDTVNHEGVSLFDSYQTLWQSVHDNEQDILPQKETIENALRMMATYPFDAVSQVMTDYVRSRTARILGLLFSPYSQRQNDALQRLLNQYPVKKEDKKILDTILSKITQINKYLEEENDNIALMNFKPMLTLVKETAQLTYQIPINYLWIVIYKLSKTFTRVYTYNGSINEVNAVIEYLTLYRKSSKRLKPFELQLVDDISTVLVFTYPHPQMVIGIENAINTLSLYYSPIQASSLFIDDVEDKMKRYLDHAHQYLGDKLINRFRNLNKEVEEQVLTPAEIYDRLLANLVKYLHEGDRTVVGKLSVDAMLLKRLPWESVAHLPQFKINIARVTEVLTKHTQGE